MFSKYLYFIVLVSLIICLGLVFLNLKNTNLISPGTGSGAQNSEEKIPTPTPIVYNFDKSTDLRSELEKVNPEVAKSDFNDLQSVINSF